jgi:hypothetical protein
MSDVLAFGMDGVPCTKGLRLARSPAAPGRFRADAGRGACALTPILTPTLY